MTESDKLAKSGPTDYNENPFLGLCRVTESIWPLCVQNVIDSRFIPAGMEILKPEYVARKIVDAIETKQTMLMLPRFCYSLPIIQG